MAGEIDIGTVAKAYSRWAPFYDLVFGAVFDAGRKASIAAAERVGGRILEVGIGTGISLTDYARTNRLVGIDYCEPMLRKAHARVAAHRLAHVEALAVMDAQQLAFADAFFDVVVAQYVITTVPDPERALDEIARVTRPGARSSWSTTSARRRACGAPSSRGLHRSPAGSAGARNSAGSGSRNGPRVSPMCGSWSAAPCRPSAISP